MERSTLGEFELLRPVRQVLTDAYPGWVLDVSLRTISLRRS
jgi:hypothetical protein